MTTVVISPNGGEHAAISDGYRRIRLDVASGTLCDGPVRLRSKLEGLQHIDPKILTLRRLIALCRLGRFSSQLHPPERLAPRWIAALRAYDALRAGATQRDMALGLYGGDAVRRDWGKGSDTLRLRVQRLAGVARKLAGGGYRELLR